MLPLVSSNSKSRHKCLFRNVMKSFSIFHTADTYTEALKHKTSEIIARKTTVLVQNTFNLKLKFSNLKLFLIITS